MPAILDKILRAGEGRVLRKLNRIAQQVNAIEEEFTELSDGDLRELTSEFRSRLNDGESLDDVLPEAFAAVRVAAQRTLGQRPFDVQLMGAAALHQGNIAEMKTGEGKTLTSALAAYLNALPGKGVHIVTVNDYLARRDAENMGRIYNFLGLTVGVIHPEMTRAERKEAYASDITYGTNNEFGFDYLRDNMARALEDCVQRGHVYAIVDEVDSILIDEARTPLVISGPAEQNSRWYTEFSKIAPKLRDTVDYEVDEKKRTVAITEAGIEKVEDTLGIDNLYESSNTALVSFLNNAIKAKELFRRDKEYIVKDGEVLIVDEFTGRVLRGRRFQEGMHQAIEAKEKVAIKNENQTLAKITLQNYFRMYDKLAGMTGTAMTEAAEFSQTYKVGVVEIPTNKPMVRSDERDMIFKTEEAKFQAIVEDIEERHEKGQPVLVGTTSVEKSEMLSRMLTKRKIPHEVLNAKNHAGEASIIARAGRLGGVTVATNMAGRGTDIMLGGNPEFMANEELQARGLTPLETPEEFEAEWPAALEKAKSEVESEHKQVIEAGGLYVLGTERHESRRIDNQLRGRSGRQGDPGESRFYLSLRDDLMRLFNSDRVEMIMDRLSIPDDQPIESKTVTRAIQTAQGTVEQQHMEARKNLLKYDDVLNEQRKVVYKRRREILEGANLKEQALDQIEDVLGGYVDSATSVGDPEEWDLDKLWTAFEQVYPITFTHEELVEQNGGSINALTPDIIRDRVIEDAEHVYDAREEEYGSEIMRRLERSILLQVRDRKWREHLYEMDYLQSGIGLRAYAQRNPLIEYQREGFDMFKEMHEASKEESASLLFQTQVQMPGQERTITAASAASTAVAVGSLASTGGSATGTTEAPTAAEDGVVIPDVDAEGHPEELEYSAPDEQGDIERHTEPADPDAAAQQGATKVDTLPKVNRNDPCPCGSGKKYKRCHGDPKTR
ncbi:preprotein translocase subunit SecA [Spiractinospora alimapuensis]|uniref:preprotein translocase subunit SecA n=1 Tax=Spiractinospora alimapuensis TaxID=2820884 RepID=UPI001EEB7C36|nr:preprotein translocase subunit SecA [Spiractinospora alimapuensis]QVQ54357.1 preprotein translocase subunit SecA [Spiractinospora alimapuensis]